MEGLITPAGTLSVGNSLGHGKSFDRPPTGGPNAPLVQRGTRIGSGLCHKPQAILHAEVHRRSVKERWQDFFANPSQWSDYRSEKGIATYPDFKHKRTQESLWLNNRANPPWVEEQLASMLAGTVQLSVFSWNKRLSASTKAGQCEKTLDWFQLMQQEGAEPNKFSFVPVLNACASLRDLEEGKRIHAMIKQSKCETDLFVANSLIDMYTKCGSIEDAWRVFDKMPTRDVVSWNSIIQGYVKCGQAQRALELSHELQRLGDPEPNSITFVGILNACASLGAPALEEGRRVYDQIIRKGLLHLSDQDNSSSKFISNSLIDMYSKCGSMDDAWKLFNALPTRNVVAWSAMIHGCVKLSQGQKALNLYKRMQQEGVQPNAVTFVAVLNACASVAALEEGKLVHEQIIRQGLESNLFIGNSLVDMYAKCGSIEDAWTVFNGMPVRCVVSYNTMIQGCVKSGLGQKALELLKQLLEEGVEPNSVTFVGLLRACICIAVHGEGSSGGGGVLHEHVIHSSCESDDSTVKTLADKYAKSGNITDAWKAFSEMLSCSVAARGLRNSNTGKGLSTSRSKSRSRSSRRQMGRQGKASSNPSPQRLQLELTKSHVSSSTPFGSVSMRATTVSASGSVLALSEGRRVHAQIIQRGWEADAIVATVLVDMYSKCGSLEDAWKVFGRMPARNVTAWSTMIHGCVKWGQAQKALKLSRHMRREGVELDYSTCIGVLNACALAAAVGEGRRVHAEIIQRGWEPDLSVASSLVNMYVKCGSIGDALKVFERMPLRNVAAWEAMILGYLKCGQEHKALELSRQMQEEGVEPDLFTFAGLLSVVGAAAAGRGAGH